MEQSPRLSLSYVMPQQAQKHVTVNESFRRLDILVQMNTLPRSIGAFSRFLGRKKLASRSR